LVAHGGPESLDEIPAFLASVLGAPASPALVAEIRARYERIGGASPLNAISRRQAGALARALSLPVFLALRHGSPSLTEAVSQAHAAGHDRLVAVSASPQFGGKFGDSTELCRRAGTQKHGNVGRTRGPQPDPQVRLLPGRGPGAGWEPAPPFQERRTIPHVLNAPSVHRHPLFIEAIAERLAPLAPGRELLFTAHSLPARLASADPEYDTEARATAAAIAARCGLPSFEFAYQSQGREASDWLGPTVESRIDALATRGASAVLVAPLSFPADNLEVLYDIDIHFRQYAAERGIRLSRTPTLGDSPLFIEALAASVRPLLEAAP
jgi:ferrochelatase